MILHANNSIIYTTYCHIQFNCTHFCMHMLFYKLKICMDKNFLPLLFSDFSQKTSNFPDFSWSSNKFWLPWSGNSALVGGNSKVKNEDPSEDNTETFFWRRWYKEVCWSRLWSSGDLHRVYIYQWVHTLTASGWVCEGKMSINTKFSTSWSL